jgi:hypothetical protein
MYYFHALSGIPPSFWGEALSSFIHVYNRVMTTELLGSTPHEAFLGSKMYCLCAHSEGQEAAWELGSHMEKCVFISYPQGY